MDRSSTIWSILTARADLMSVVNFSVSYCPCVEWCNLTNTQNNEYTVWCRVFDFDLLRFIDRGRGGRRAGGGPSMGREALAGASWARIQVLKQDEFLVRSQLVMEMQLGRMKVTWDSESLRVTWFGFWGWLRKILVSGMTSLGLEKIFILPGWRKLIAMPKQHSISSICSKIGYLTLRQLLPIFNWPAAIRITCDNKTRASDRKVAIQETNSSMRLQQDCQQKEKWHDNGNLHWIMVWRASQQESHGCPECARSAVRGMKTFDRMN